MERRDAKRGRAARTVTGLIAVALLLAPTDGALGAEAGEPLAVYHPDPEHVSNRLFAALYTRPREVPGWPGATEVRTEGGDVIDFLAWSGTTHWSSEETTDRLAALLDEWLARPPEERISDPLHRAVLLRDLWAPFDHYVTLNAELGGTHEERARRTEVARRLARAIASLALSREEIDALPDTWTAAVTSGAFPAAYEKGTNAGFLPPDLFSDSERWVEIDFFDPKMPDSVQDRLLSMHTWSYRARSYFRILYGFPGGRPAVEEYLAMLGRDGVDWRRSAQQGFLQLRPDLPQIPDGTAFALVQFMMTLDEDLRPVPTKIVESARFRIYDDVSGQDDPPTNTGIGMNVFKYEMRRRLLFDGVRNGGLERKDESEKGFDVLFQTPATPDWGERGYAGIAEQCADCHHYPKEGLRPGVYGVYSAVNMASFTFGAPLGISVPLPAEEPGTRGRRAADWKDRHETLRRLRELAGR